MANNWIKGQLGLQFFNSVNSTFDEMVDGFADDINAQYTNESLITNPSFTDDASAETRKVAANSIYTDVLNISDPSFTNIDIDTHTYQNQLNIDEPNYNDVGMNV
tara:strand:- start:1678 stop:1992 length:315 start_codon:yes stop_codon:yes gene_type:complete